LKGL
jgi:hypothetical protein